MTSWRVSPDRELLIRQWSKELVVYDCRTGDTHLLEELASQVFLLLKHQPASSEAVVDHIAAHFALETDDDLVSEVHAILENLAILSLIRET